MHPQQTQKDIALCLKAWVSSSTAFPRNTTLKELSADLKGVP